LKKQLGVANGEIRSTSDLPAHPEDAPDRTILKEKAKVPFLKGKLADSKVQQRKLRYAERT